VFEEFAEGRNPDELGEMLKICKQHEILLKAHNTDYLSDKALSIHIAIGIHAANVAPEFGVVETLSFLKLVEGMGFQDIADQFLALSFASRKWEKWMTKDSLAGDRERAIICGHYVFGTAQFKELRNQFELRIKARNLDLDAYLQRDIEGAIVRYLSHFGLLHASLKRTA